MIYQCIILSFLSAIIGGFLVGRSRKFAISDYNEMMEHCKKLPTIAQLDEWMKNAYRDREDALHFRAEAILYLKEAKELMRKKNRQKKGKKDS